MSAEGVTARPWPEGTWPTAEQLTGWLAVCTEDERLDFADQAIRSAKVADRCFLQNHHQAVLDVSICARDLNALRLEIDGLRRELAARATEGETA